MRFSRRRPSVLLAVLPALLVAGLASPAGAATVAPDPPTAVTASPGNAAATVTWTAPTNTGATAVSGYTVTSAPGGLTATATTTRATVTGLSNGTTYTFTVTASNSLGTSTPSGMSNAVTPAGAPTAPGMVTSTPGDRQVALSWTASSANGPGPVSYTVSSDPQAGAISVANGGTGTTASVTGLTNGTAYTFVVTALNGASQSTASSPATATPAAVPAAPFSVNATRGKLSATVGWSAPSANGSAVTSYTVTSSPGGITATAAGSATGVTVSGLSDGTSYTFTVTATNGVGTSLPSAVSNAVVPGETPNPPTAVVVANGDLSVPVSWTAPGSTGDPVLDYTVTASPGGASVTVPGTSATVTGLTNGTSYTFTVTARTQNGSSVPSVASAPVTPYGLPRTPLRPTVFGGDGTASVSFTPTNGNGSAITGYTVTATPSNGGAPVVARNAVSPVTLGGLTDGLAYAVTVGATNAAGTSTSGATGVTPASPGTAQGVAAPTGPVLVTLALDRTFVVNGASVVASGRVTEGGLAAPAGTPVGIDVVYSDGKAVVLTVATTVSGGTFSATLVPVYSGTLTASTLGATSAPVPSKVIVSFTSVKAAVSGRRVSIAAASAPGFFTGPGRAERAQVLLLNGDGSVRRVLATISAAQRHAAAGTQHGVNDLRWSGTLAPGTYRIAIKVIGTPVNTGAQTVTRTVTVHGGVVTPASP